MTRATELVKQIGYRDSRGYEYLEVDIDCLELDSRNPRIEEQKSSLETLLAIVKADPAGLFHLAADIIEQGGFNPGEIPNVVPTDSGRFLVREANRRLAARKLLLNPEVLRDHLPATEVTKWRKLASLPEAKALPNRVLVVSGADHEAWVDRRHLGPQSGAGLIPWNPEAKRRREQRKRASVDLPLLLLDSLKAQDPDRFAPLEPPKRTFTTFARLVESQEGRALLGVSVDPQGRVTLDHGKRSLALVEEVLRDLRLPVKERLTSRKIHSTDQIRAYLQGLENRISSRLSETPIALPPTAAGTSPLGPGSGARKRPTRRKVSDVLNEFHVPTERRLRKVFDELDKARRGNAPNAAMILTRVLLELAIDAFATGAKLDFARDVDAQLAAELREFLEAARKARVPCSKSLKRAVERAATRPVGFADKIRRVIDHLASTGSLPKKEAEAKKREIRDLAVVETMNDAVHRLLVNPTTEKVTHVLEVVQPVYNLLVETK